MYNRLIKDKKLFEQYVQNSVMMFKQLEVEMPNIVSMVKNVSVNN